MQERSIDDLRDYARARFVKLGEGSDRVVYFLGNGKVLKIAKNTRGRDQNANEVEIGSNPRFTNIVARVFEWAPDGRAWIISEHVFPFQRGYDFEQAVMSVQEFRTLVSWMSRSPSFLQAVRNYVVRDSGFLKKREQKEYEKALLSFPFLANLYALLRETGIAYRDLQMFDHYGFASDGRLVVLDYGLKTQIAEWS